MGEDSAAEQVAAGTAAMGEGSVAESVAAGAAALGAGRWADAQAFFGTALDADVPLPTALAAEAAEGLARALWWLGDSRGAVAGCTQAYALHREAHVLDGAVRCAVWLGITFSSDFGNAAAANGWLRRAERLLPGTEVGALHAWLWVAQAYRMADLPTAQALTERALDVARTLGDPDLELVALAQLGRVHVGLGRPATGFAMLDEAMAAALGGERASLDTVVYACCDMLTACEQAADLVRAAQWCAVADDFVTRFGCPFLHAECRTVYGSVLLARGSWPEAERELSAALRVGAGPAMHARASARLAELRLRQGRLEDAGALLDELDRQLADEVEAALTRAALLLARGDAAAASAVLTDRLDAVGGRGPTAARALSALVDANLAAGDTDAAAEVAARLGAVEPAAHPLVALAAAARGRVALSRGDEPAAVAELRRAVSGWTELGQPYETALCRLDLARAMASGRHDLAVEHARAALAVFRRLGASAAADRAAAVLRSLGVRPPAGPVGVGTLTRRERDVLVLLGLGLSNPEIAGRLHVSRKTAAHHVSSILTKLDLRNRSAAAAAAAVSAAQRD